MSSNSTPPKYLNLAGVPLGGIGCGKIELCPDGAFRNLTIHNNVDIPVTDIHNPFKPMPSFPVADMDTCPELSPAGMEACFFGAFVEGAGALVLKEQEHGLTDTVKKGAIAFNGEVPTVDLRYPNLGEVELSLAAFSSLILNEPAAARNRDSALPAISFKLRAVNKSDQPRRVSFIFTFANLIGIGGFPNAAMKDFRSNFIRYVDTDGPRRLEFGHKTPKMDERVNGSYTLACNAEADTDITHALWSIEPNHASKQRMWKSFSTEGKLANNADWGSFVSGALCASRVVAPGETFEVPFVFAWHFPVRTDSKERGIRYRNAYANHFASSLEVANYVIKNEATLRAANPSWWITHNGCFSHIDFAGDFTRDLDFLSYDSYPLFEFDWTKRAANQAFNTDYVRAYSGNFVVLEQQSGAGGQDSYLLDTPEPGEMSKYVWVNVARGADGMLLFRERTCRFGAEEYWGGILDHDNVPRRRYREAAQLGAELKRVGPAVLGTSVTVRIAVCGAHSETQSAHAALPLGLPSPRQIAENVHGYFFRAGHAVGCLHPADSLEGISTFFVTHFAMIDPAWIPAWTAWVEAGGVLVIGARTGSKDLDNNVVAETLPGALRPLVGATVEEYGHQNRAALRPLTLRIGGATVTTDIWYEQLLPDAGTEVVGIWDSRHLKGSAAITRRRHGKGWVYYVGSYFTEPLIAAVAEHLATARLLPEPLSTTPLIEVVERRNADRTLRFYINHAEHTLDVPLAAPGHDLISDRPVSGSIRLEPTQVAVVRHD